MSYKQTAGQVCPPFLRWAGSKRRLLPVLQEFWTTEHKRYLEPFAGSACLFFALDPPKAILGDLNPELIATYLEIKYRVDDVLKCLFQIPVSNRAAYLKLRAANTADISSAKRAARFIYLNRFCFNGIYRTNLAGQFNVPFSGDRCGGFPRPDVFKRCSRRLRAARFVRGDFERVLAHARKGDLVYMDPPFAVRAQRVFREYDPSTFKLTDIKRLRSSMKRLDGAKVSFVVSYAESDESEILRKGFSCETVSVPRNIASFAAHRSRSNEVLIYN